MESSTSELSDKPSKKSARNKSFRNVHDDDDSDDTIGTALLGNKDGQTNTNIAIVPRQKNNCTISPLLAASEDTKNAQRHLSQQKMQDPTRNQHNLYTPLSPTSSSASPAATKEQEKVSKQQKQPNKMSRNINININPIETQSSFSKRSDNQVPSSTTTTTTIQLNDDGHCSTSSTRHPSHHEGVHKLSPSLSSAFAGQGDDGGSSKRSHRSSTSSLNNIEIHMKDIKNTGRVTPPSTSDAGEDVPDPDRETWGQSLDFLLSIIGFAVDLANVWRFPYFCYKNGGGAFLIPYFLMLAFSAVPVFYMELLLGQSIRQGPISVWKICPLFKGIGYCAVTVSYFVSFYYNTIMGWSLHYTINSFSTPLPWTTCNNSWNTENCHIPLAANDQEDNAIIEPSSTTTTVTTLSSSSSLTSTEIPTLRNFTLTRPPNATSPASEYFRNSVLEMGNSNIENLGSLKIDLVACVALIYCLLYLILFRGIRSTGKVVWLTATLPYAVMAILLVRGLLLDGASDGIYYYLVPNMTKLMEVEVWSDAAKQIFFSSGAGFGVHLTYASYNNFHNNCYRDCLVTSFVNCFTSLFSGFVIFTFLGSMAKSQRRPISEVVNIGPGLVFEVYPEAVGSLPGANFWSLLFFLMLIMLGIDSAMGGLECVVTGITDEFKNVFKHKKHSREWFMVVIVLMSFIISLVNVTRGGMYTFTFFDTYAAGSSLLLAVLFEVLVVSWVYGLDQLCSDAEAMLGSPPGIYWRICWKFISPLFIAIIILLDLWTALPMKYDEYVYPEWAQIFGYIFTFFPITLVPIVALSELYKFPGSCKRKLAYAITPVNEHNIIKNTNNVKRFKYKHWVYIQ